MAKTNKIDKSNGVVSIEDTLKERGSRYGVFMDHAGTTQRLKNEMHSSEKWSMLAHDQKECLEMIAHKIGRILNGDPDYPDSWHDIVGYAKLVDDRLQKKFGELEDEIGR